MFVLPYIITAGCAFFVGVVAGWALPRRGRRTPADWMAYRARLYKADSEGDTAFLAREMEKNQLTADDLKRLRQYHTPLEDWPEPDEGLMDPADIIDPPRPNRAAT